MDWNFSDTLQYTTDDWMQKPVISGKFISMTKLRPDCLPEIQVTLYNLFKTREWLNDYYLARGTGLALQIGHRESIDFDFLQRMTSMQTNSKPYFIKQKLPGVA